MPGSTTNMGLVTWTNLTDFFSHTDLINNWTKVDLHDHVPVGSGGNGGLPIPGAGIQSGSITNTKLADAAVTKVKLGADVDYELAFSTWKPITGWIGGSSVATLHSGTHLLATPSWGSSSATSSGSASGIFYLDPAAFTAGTRTVRYRVRALCATNLVAPTIAPKVSLATGVNPIFGSSGSPNSWGGSGLATYADFTGIITSNGQFAEVVSAAFTAPAAGFNGFAVLMSSTAATGAVLEIRACLEMQQT